MVQSELFRSIGSEDDVDKRVKSESAKISTVVVHPLVLLSVVDHYNRIRDSRTRRVVGVLLGEQTGSTLDVSNSFAVPFEEDATDPSVWFLDHQYLENMFTMFEKVNARERIVGWYHSGPKLSPKDIRINELIRKYNINSVLVVVDVSVQNKETEGLPTEAYIAVDEIHDDGTPTTKTFDRLQTKIDAEEAEEVGVEHLLRDIKDTTLGVLSQRIVAQLDGLSGLLHHLHKIGHYLNLVTSGKIAVNHCVIYQLQDIFNLLPDLRLHDMVRAINVSTNDQMLVIYVAAIIRTILALHDLINNKLANRETERSEEGGGATDAGKKAAGDQNKSNAAVENGTDAAANEKSKK